MSHMKRPRTGRTRPATVARRTATGSTRAAAVPPHTSTSSPPSTSSLQPQGKSTTSTDTLAEIVQHVFYLVYLCGVPVHYRYVVHLLRRSSEAAEWRKAHRTSPANSTTRAKANKNNNNNNAKSKRQIASASAAVASGGASAQQWWAWLRQTTQEKVFEAVCAQANAVNARIMRAQLNTLPSNKEEKTKDEVQLAPLSQVTQLVLESEGSNSDAVKQENVQEKAATTTAPACTSSSSSSSSLQHVRMRVVELPSAAASTNTMRTYALFQRRYTNEYADVLALKPPPLSLPSSQEQTEGTLWSAEAAYYAALAQAQAVEAAASHASNAVVVVADDDDDGDDNDEGERESVEHNCALLPARHRPHTEGKGAARQSVKPEAELVLSSTTATLTTQVIAASASPSRPTNDQMRVACASRAAKRRKKEEAGGAEEDDDSVVIISGESSSEVNEEDGDDDDDVALIV